MNNNSIICPHCGTKNKPTAQFCINCGKSLQGVQTSQESQTKTNHHKSIARNSIILLVLLALVAGTIWSQTLPKSAKHHFSAVKATKVSNSPKKKVHNSKTETKELDQLSSSDLKKLGIKFQIQQYIGAQSQYHRLFIKLSNPTNKTIQISPNKITSSNSDIGVEAASTMISLAPHAKSQAYLVYSQVIGNSLDNLETTNGYWDYGQSDLKLQPLSDTEKLPNDTTQPNRKGDTVNPNADSSSSSIASSSSSQASQSITSSAQAIAAVKAKIGTSINGVPVSWSTMGTARSEMSQDTNGKSCYWVRGRRSTDTNMSSYDSLDFYVYTDGTVVPDADNNYGSDADNNNSSNADSDDNNSEDNDNDDDSDNNDSDNNNTADTNDDNSDDDE